MGKDLLQKSLKDSLFTGIIALALFGPIVGLRTVAKNEVLVVEPKWLVVLLIVIFCAVGRFFINLYTFKKEQRRGEPSSFGKTIANFLDEKGAQIAIAAIVFSIIFPFMPFADRYWMDIAIMMMTYIMLGWGLNIVIGLAGLLDLGYVAFYAVGAYSYALFAIHFGWSFWICLPIAGLFAGMFGILLGFPVLRLRGDYLAIVTLAFGEMIRILLLNWYELTRGPDGLTGIPRPSFFGLPFKRYPDEGVETFHTFFGLEYDPMQRIIFLYYLILILAL
jgi:ABC-type branched-chain amino acid transport system, permease component